MPKVLANKVVLHSDAVPEGSGVSMTDAGSCGAATRAVEPSLDDLTEMAIAHYNDSFRSTGDGSHYDAMRAAVRAVIITAGRLAVPVDVQPFVTLESMHECLSSLRSCMGLRRTEKFKPPVGSPAYYADAIEDKMESLFQQLVVMLPEEHARTEG